MREEKDRKENRGGIGRRESRGGKIFILYAISMMYLLSIFFKENFLNNYSEIDTCAKNFLFDRHFEFFFLNFKLRKHYFTNMDT